MKQCTKDKAWILLVNIRLGVSCAPNLLLSDRFYLYTSTGKFHHILVENPEEKYLSPDNTVGLQILSTNSEEAPIDPANPPVKCLFRAQKYMIVLTGCATCRQRKFLCKTMSTKLKLFRETGSQQPQLGRTVLRKSEEYSVTACFLPADISFISLVLN